MERVNRDYELTMLKIATDIYLNKLVAFTEEGLKSLESNRDRFVWELATKFYSQSGHKADFCLLRDVVNCWIESKKVQLANMRRAEEEKARQIAAEANRRIVEEKARLYAEEKARTCARTLLLEEIDKFAEQIANNKGNEEVSYTINYLGNRKVGIFFKLHKILTEYLNLGENTVDLESNLRSDLGADSLDAVELMMALEEEFNIEIPDEAAEQITTVEQAVNYIHYKLSA